MTRALTIPEQRIAADTTRALRIATSGRGDHAYPVFTQRS